MGRTKGRELVTSLKRPRASFFFIESMPPSGRFISIQLSDIRTDLVADLTFTSTETKKFSSVDNLIQISEGISIF